MRVCTNSGTICDDDLPRYLRTAIFRDSDVWRYVGMAIFHNDDAVQERPRALAMCMIGHNHQNDDSDGDESLGLTAMMAMSTLAHAPERIEYAMTMTRFLSQ